MGSRVESYTAYLNDGRSYTVCGNDLLTIPRDELFISMPLREREESDVCEFCGHALV